MDNLEEKLPDVELEAQLKEGLARPGLPELALARLQARVETEWRRQLRARRTVESLRWAGLLAASLCACAVVGWRMLGQQPAMLGELAASTAANLRVSHSRLLLRAAPRPNVLLAGQSVETTGNAVIALSTGGWLRIKAGSVVEITAGDEIRLERGAVYVDFDAALSHGELRVQTPYGRVQHLGTQFEVALVGDAARIRVREGAVQVIGPVGARVASGEELQLDGSHVIATRAFAPYDPAWAWVESPGRDFVVDGQSALELLHWVARETGRQLEFRDERANQLAAGTVLHGSIRGLSPDLALRALLSTTSLAVDVREAQITVPGAP